MVKPAAISKSWREIPLYHEMEDHMGFEEEDISAA
jgi:hypothetical protein